MFLIKTYIAKSNIDGLGLFTSDTIQPDQIVARWNPELDRTLHPDIFQSLPVTVQQYIRKHGTRDVNGHWKLGMDGDQYINHSDKPNLNRTGDVLIAHNIIKPGEELTCDYRPFRTDI